MEMNKYNQKVQLFVMTHKRFQEPRDPMYLPLQVGKKNKQSLGYLGDDTGDEISAENPYFSELTGMYWVWKNYHDAQIVGICHYRRYLLSPDTGKVFTKEEIQQLLNRYDMIATEKITLPKSYYEGFSGRHHEKDLIELEKVIQERSPEIIPVYQNLIHKNQTYFANMMICRKELYDEYCQWLFDILLELQKRTDMSNYDDYCKRLFGFLSEILLYIWSEYKHLQVFEAHVALIGEKAETRELKEKLQIFFEKKDLAGARSFLLNTLKSRPDVLMEASDTNGELKLSMELISICEYEIAQTGTSMLEQCSDFEVLLGRLKNLNSGIDKYRIGTITPEELKSLLKNTTQALYVAVQVMCWNPADAQKVYQELAEKKTAEAVL